MNRILFAALIVTLAACSDVSGPYSQAGPYQPVPVATVEVLIASLTSQVSMVLEVKAVVKDAAGAPLIGRRVTWTTSDSTIATVVESGLQSAVVHLVAVGTVTVSASAEGQKAGVTLTATAPPPTPRLVVARPFIYSIDEGMVEMAGFQNVSSYPTDINDEGQVVGTMQVGSAQHAFLWSKEKGTLDLGVPAGWDQSFAHAINNAGEVVGEVVVVSAQGTIAASNAFKWTAATGMVMLPSRSQFDNTHALDINNNGEIVGFSVASVSNYSGLRPVRWSAAKGIEDLGTLPGQNEGIAESINDDGQIAGYSSEADYYSSDNIRAMLWDPQAGIIDISGCGGGGGCVSEANAIDQQGQIVGAILGKPFRWSKAGGLTELGVEPGARYSNATDINSIGQVSVNQAFGDHFTERAFVWTAAEGMRSIGFLPGATTATATAINNKGQIVGSSR